MMASKEFIDSGIIEQYVLGIASPAECEEVEKMAAADPDVRREMGKISQSLEQYAILNAIEPNPIIKPFLMAIVDYSERMANGEALSFPPLLHLHSTSEDYATWLNRQDMGPSGADDVSAKIISFTPEVTTAIVWLKKYAPQEIHDKEFERFLIIEGTCDIIVEEEVNHLVAGDYFEIPLHKKHVVHVTSFTPCKIILQRVAA